MANKALALLLIQLLALPTMGVAAVAPRRATPKQTLASLTGSGGLAPADAATRARVEAGLGKMPLYFVENRGQIDPRVLYYVKGAANSVYFTRTGIVFALTSRVGGRQEGRGLRPASLTAGPPSVEPAAMRHVAIGLDFEGANPEVKVVGRDRTSAIVSHFKGQASEWKTALPTYTSVVYEELWPGIDLVYGSESGKPKYSFIVKPGANPDRIRLVYRGANGVRLTEAGRLEIETPAGSFGEDRPYAYQEGRETKTEVAAAFEPEADATEGEYRFGFLVGAYDRTRPLVLDPVVLAYCGYIGGAANEEYWWAGIAVSSDGYAYVVGSTWSDGVTEGFPVVPGSWNTTLSSQGVFVAKVNQAGTALVYCGYIGGGYAGGIAVDDAGNAYVVGRTTGGLPVVGGFDAAFNGGSFDAFVAKINPAGTALVYCSYLGGANSDWGNGIAVDGSGNAYVVGHTDSPATGGSPPNRFPVVAGSWDTVYAGGTGPDAFVAKVNAAGNALVYCGYLGGTQNDEGRAIALDGSGNAYVLGYTWSNETTDGFPVIAGSWDTTLSGGAQLFVAKINSTGAAPLVYCGYLGGGGEQGGIAVDGSGNAYVTGASGSTLPVVAGSWDVTYAGGTDAFVAKINAAGTALVYCGYIGGSNTEYGADIALDSSGNAYVVGWTDSDETMGFPVTAGPDLTYNGGWTDVFVAKISADGTQLLYCGYIGGTNPAGFNDEDKPAGIAVDGSGNAYVFGITDSTDATFPVTVGPDTSYNDTGGFDDAFVAKISSVATAVELVSFSAAAGDGEVDLSWETGTEQSNLGFHVYRATADSGSYTRITSSLIAGLGSSPVGARYFWRDSGLMNGRSYYYKLEDVETTGRTKLHGPVVATPQTAAAGAPASGSSASGPETAPAPSPAPNAKSLLTYGDPTQVSLRVLERGARGATLELVTGGFYAEPLSDGSVRLTVPGFETLSEPGLASLPVERTMLEALVGLGVRVASVQASDVAGFRLRPEAAGVPELVVGRDGTLRAGLRGAARRAWRGAYPEQAARVVSVGFQGEVKKALLELAPLRWDEESGQLLLARRLRVRVVFTGREKGERGRGVVGKRERTGERGLGVQGAPVRRVRRRASAAGLVAQLSTREAGLYGVRFEQVFGARGREVPAYDLSLSYQGTPVAFSVAPDPRRFAKGSTLYFVSAGERSNPYGNEAVYELSSGEAGPSMAQATAYPSGASLSEAVAQREYEINRHYLSNVTTGPDPWLWEYLRTGERKSVVLSLSQLAASSAAGRIEIGLMGVSDYPVTPDHHVRASLNGTYVGELSWDGKTAKTLVAEVPGGVLREGDNVLELENVGDTPASYSLFYLDRVSLSYPRALSAAGGRFEGSFAFSGQATVAGLGSGAALVDTTSATPVWLTGGVSSPSGLSFRAESGHRYLAVSGEGLLVPEVRLAAASTLRASTNQADYIVIAPRAYLGEAEALLSHREAQGLTTLGVAFEEVYAQFGHGEARPEAIRDFLTYAYHHWSAPAPRYVLLLGDASYDPKNYLGARDPAQLLPTPLIRSSFLWTASDPSLGAINGEDGLPDVAIGRLSASTVEEAHSLIQKLIAWEDSGFTLQGPATLVSDNPDPAGDFEADADEIAGTILASRQPEHISLARLGVAGTRAAIQTAFDRGVSLMSYIGHGSSMLWASEQVLKPNDVDALGPQGQQGLVLTMNCLNGFFHLPVGNSLSEKLIKVEGKGAIAAFSSSGMSFNDPAHLYHKALLSEIVSGTHERLGDALLAAQAAYADTGADPELLALYHLLGDPALRIR